MDIWLPWIAMETRIPIFGYFQLYIYDFMIFSKQYFIIKM